MIIFIYHKYMNNKCIFSVNLFYLLLSTDVVGASATLGLLWSHSSTPIYGTAHYCKAYSTLATICAWTIPSFNRGTSWKSPSWNMSAPSTSNYRSFLTLIVVASLMEECCHPCTSPRLSWCRLSQLQPKLCTWSQCMPTTSPPLPLYPPHTDHKPPSRTDRGPWRIPA